MVLKGARCAEKRESVDGKLEEMFGPPVAVPFKWEEEPGKAKPSEAEKKLQIQNDDDFYRLLLSKEGKLGVSSGSLYRPEDAGTVPFDWEAEPGKPKTPSREPDEHKPAILNPPPSFHFSPRSELSVIGPKTSSISLKKWIFLGRSTKSGELYRESINNSMNNNYRFSGSSDGVSKSSNYSSDVFSKSGTVTCSSSACSSRAASPRRKFYPHGATCFSGANPTKSSAPSFQRSISTGSSCNKPAGPSCLQNPKNSFTSELPRGGEVDQSLQKTVDQKAKEVGEFEHEKESLQLKGESEFQNSVSDSAQDSDDHEPNDRISKVSDSGDCESDDHGAIKELEILMRFPLVKHGNKKVAPMYGAEVSESPRGFSSCLPICAILSRRAKVYEDCLDLQRKE